MQAGQQAPVLRPTTPQDFPEVRSLFSDPAFAGWGGPGFRSDEQLRSKYLGGRLPDVECFLIIVGDRVVGFTQLYADGSGAGMDLILLPAERGKGLGRRVVELLLERVLSTGRSHLVVDPSPDDHAAVAFWHAVGFRGDGVLAHPLAGADVTRFEPR